MNELIPTLPPSRIPTLVLRGERVVLAQDLAKLFGVETKRLNEQVSRNTASFAGYAFQLSHEEAEGLRSQSATSNAGRGGRRYLPWAFTEHGVVMAATVLNSDAAVSAMKLIVEVFVQERRRVAEAAAPAVVGARLVTRLRGALETLLDTVVDQRSQSTVREEAQELLAQSIQHLKDRLSRQGLENEVQVSMRLAVAMSPCSSHTP